MNPSRVSTKRFLLLVFLSCLLIIGFSFFVKAPNLDTTGTMIYYDDMESLRMRLVNVQGQGAIGLTNQDYANQGLYDNKYSVFLRTNTSENDESYAFRALPMTEEKVIETEFYLNTPFRYVNWNESRHKAFIFKIHFWDGTYVRLFGIKWLAETGQLQYWDSSGAWQNILNVTRILWGEPASHIKLIVDAGDSEGYIMFGYTSLYVDEETFDLSSYSGQEMLSFNPPAIDLQFHAISTGLNYDEILIADLTITSYEGWRPLESWIGRYTMIALGFTGIGMMVFAPTWVALMIRKKGLDADSFERIMYAMLIECVGFGLLVMWLW